MTVRHLRMFLAVCEHGSVTGAAEALYMTQPAVSLAIKELEAHYGLKLFDRLSRRVQITGDGRRLLEYAVHAVDLFDEMERAVKNPDAVGELLVGSSLTIGACLLPGYLKRLRETCPGLRPRVTVDNTERIIGLVRAGRLDVGLVEGAVNQSSLVVRNFLEDRLIAVCGMDHAFSRAAAVELDEFLSEPLLLRERGSGTRELFESAVTLLGKEIAPALESISTTAIIRALEAGEGVSVLPERLVCEHLVSGRLHEVPLRSLPLNRNFSLIYHKNKYLSAGMRALIDVVTGEHCI